MAVLNSWQKITRVLPGMPFGSGADGAYSSATIPTITYKSCSGTATSTTLTASTSSPFTAGDVILIHQTRGTGAGQWEINRVASVGSGQYTLQEALYYTYTDSGASQAQAVKIPQYTTCAIPSGTWTTTNWGGDVGGIFPVAAKVSLTISGTLTVKGSNGSSGVTSGGGASGGGFRGGNVIAGTTPATGWAGEGTANASIQTASANGNGGAGGIQNSQRVGGGGGGHSTTGGSGNGSFGASDSVGGSASGSADLTTITFGGGGAGGNQDRSDAGGAGGGASSGGIIMLFAKTITGVNSITITGGTGGSYSSDSSNASGGGAGGGSCLIVCGTATLGTNTIVATGGAGGGGNTYGGAGRNGRIAIHHSSTVTGTTTPTFTDVSDPTLIESNAGFILNLIQ